MIKDYQNKLFIILLSLILAVNFIIFPPIFYFLLLTYKTIISDFKIKINKLKI